jgi:hypothetical protein
MESVAFLIILAGLGLALGMPLVILGVFLHRVRVLKRSWKLILVKAVCAVIAWACLSFLMLYFDFAYVYANAHTPPPARAAIMPAIRLLLITLVYGLAGWGLCRWVGRDEQPARYDLGLT